MNPSLMNLLLYGGCLAIGYILAGGKFDFLTKLTPKTPVPEPLPNPVSPAVVPQPVETYEEPAVHWHDQNVSVPLHELMMLVRDNKGAGPDA